MAREPMARSGLGGNRTLITAVREQHLPVGQRARSTDGGDRTHNLLILSQAPLPKLGYTGMLLARASVG